MNFFIISWLIPNWCFRNIIARDFFSHFATYTVGSSDLNRLLGCSSSSSLSAHTVRTVRLDQRSVVKSSCLLDITRTAAAPARSVPVGPFQLSLGPKAIMTECLWSSTRGFYRGPNWKLHAMVFTFRSHWAFNTISNPGVQRFFFFSPNYFYRPFKIILEGRMVAAEGICKGIISV